MARRALRSNLSTTTDISLSDFERRADRGADDLGVAGGDGQIAAQGLSNDDAVERVFVAPGESAGEDRISGSDRQLCGAHIGKDVSPGRQQGFAVETPK